MVGLKRKAPKVQPAAPLLLEDNPERAVVLVGTSASALGGVEDDTCNDSNKKLRTTIDGSADQAATASQSAAFNEFGAMANMNITGILEKMTGKDKDYRYMATSDLLSELNKESFKADQDLESKLTNIVLQQLEDASGDVSGLAVKWPLKF
ncbi:hypothetical protein ZWY2020_014029 [Hordeum vulgare]|nr:hypothetical protein ZWY2020_014029 [Hordeum vulgare]